MSTLLARPEPAISHTDLMHATPGKLFAGRGWIFELKYDGYRCLALKCGKSVRLLTRNGNDLASRFPELVAELRAIKADVVLDGELVICDGLGRSGPAVQAARATRAGADQRCCRGRASVPLRLRSVVVQRRLILRQCPRRQRDGGRCVICGATDELHFDHDLPWSKGGTSFTELNVQLMCARHNLEKRDRIA